MAFSGPDFRLAMVTRPRDGPPLPVGRMRIGRAPFGRAKFGRARLCRAVCVGRTNKLGWSLALPINNILGGTAWEGETLSSRLCWTYEQARLEPRSPVRLEPCSPGIINDLVGGQRLPDGRARLCRAVCFALLLLPNRLQLNRFSPNRLLCRVAHFAAYLRTAPRDLPNHLCISLDHSATVLAGWLVDWRVVSSPAAARWVRRG